MHCRSRPCERCAKEFLDPVRRRAADPLKHMHEGKHLVITAVGARETDAELLGRTRKRSGTKKRQKKIERFSIHAADKGRQTMLVERLERIDGILSALAFPTKNRFRH